MKSRWICTVMIIVLSCCASGVHAESDNQFGFGLNYWRMVDDVDLYNIDENGLSWLVTYQYRKISLLKIELDLEVFPKGFQGIESVVLVPEFYLVFGSTLYGAVGFGLMFGDGHPASEFVTVARVGVDFEIVPRIHLDFNLNYRYAEWSSLSPISTNVNANNTTLGLGVRFAF